MKNLVILLNLLCILNTNAQSCYRDSIYLKKIDTEIDSLVSKGAFYLFNSPLLSTFLSREKSKECLVLNYAITFDAFVSKGVILKGRLPKPNPKVSIFSADSLRHIELNNDFKKRYPDNTHIYSLFKLFINIKKEFEFQFTHKLTKDELESLIHRVTEFCPLSNPKIVIDILNNKYKHVNDQKFNKDMMYYMK